MNKWETSQTHPSNKLLYQEDMIQDSKILLGFKAENKDSNKSLIYSTVN